MQKYLDCHFGHSFSSRQPSLLRHWCSSRLCNLNRHLPGPSNQDRSCRHHQNHHPEDQGECKWGDATCVYLRSVCHAARCQGGAAVVLPGCFRHAALMLSVASPLTLRTMLALHPVLCPHLPCCRKDAQVVALATAAALRCPSGPFNHGMLVLRSATCSLG